MLGRRSPQISFFDAQSLSHCVPADSFYGRMAAVSDVLFPDEDLAVMYCPDSGRPSLPPSLMNGVSLLQFYDNVSDEEAVERAKFDMRWKVALKLPLDFPGFHPTSLTKYRNRLIENEQEGYAFDRFITVGREAGFIPDRVTLLTDTTNVKGAGAVQDTHTLLRKGMRKLLKAAGIDPKEIDTLLITHAHPDHIGGMFDADGNLNFPNARYYVAQKEWEFWMSADPSAVEAEALRHHLELLVKEARRAFNAIEDQVTLVQGSEEVVPGVRFEPTFGHTPGHVLVSISAADQTVYNISDVVVDPLFLEHPEWAPRIDMDAGKADEARRRFFARAADESALVFAHHLGPFPNLGRITGKGDSWRWESIETEE